MANEITFTARLEKAPTNGGWHYLRLGDDIVATLREASGKNGNVPVVVTVGDSTWPSTTMSRGEQQWFVAVKAEVRTRESIAEGDAVTMTLVPDESRLRMLRAGRDGCGGDGG